VRVVQVRVWARVRTGHRIRGRRIRSGKSELPWVVITDRFKNRYKDGNKIFFFFKRRAITMANTQLYIRRSAMRNHRQKLKRIVYCRNK